MKSFSLALLLGAAALHAQDPYDGLWQGFDGEWGHVSRQLIALAEATHVDRFGWRQGSGIRSTSDYYGHAALSNVGLLSYMGTKMLPDLPENAEKMFTEKAQVIAWLNRSLEAVKAARAKVKPSDLKRKVKVDDRDGTVDGM